MPKCRICEKPIDKDVDDWIMPSKNWYYHRKCYTDWKVSDTHDDKDWINLIYDFIARDLKVSYNYHMCEKQRKKYISEQKYTNKGIYFTLKYFYEIKNGDWSKGHGGLGIIPYVYGDATQYWTEREYQRRGTLEEMEKQIICRNERAIMKVTRIKKEKKEKWSLDDI